MTLIAFALYGDHAEFLTDTASYTSGAEQMGKCTKSVLIHHLDSAVLSQGDGQFGYNIKNAALQLAGHVTDYDQLVQAIPEHAQDLWRRQIEDQGAEPVESVFFLIGFSGKSEAYTAHAYASEEGFIPVEVTQPWVMPAPWSLRPSTLELERIKEWMRDHPDTSEAARIWSTRPTLTAPASVDEWRDLGLTCRTERSLQGGYARVIVAGGLLHTHLERGGAMTRNLAEFNDAGEEFLQMISFTQHPQAQVMACWCDSGERFIDCHLAPHLDQPCGCKSGETFRECCAVG